MTTAKSFTVGRHVATAPDLERILWRVHELGISDQLMLTRIENGWQASRKHKDGSFKVAQQENPVDALKECLGPEYNGTWEEHLKLDEEF